MASQSRAAKHAWKHSTARLAAFSSRGAGRLSSSNRASAASMSASSNISQRLIRSPSTVRRAITSPLGVEALLRGPMRRVGDDRSEVAQPMHSLDVDVDVRRDVPRGTDVCGHVTGRESRPAPVVDVYPVRCRRGEFVSVECGVVLRDDRPRVRVAGRFAGEVSGIEFRERGVDVVEVEGDVRRDPVVGVDLDDVEHIGLERCATSGATEGEKLTASRNRRSRLCCRSRPRRLPAIRRCRHPDRAGSRRSRPDGDPP